MKVFVVTDETSMCFVKTRVAVSNGRALCCYHSSFDGRPILAVGSILDGRCHGGIGGREGVSVEGGKREEGKEEGEEEWAQLLASQLFLLCTICNMYMYNCIR